MSQGRVLDLAQEGSIKQSTLFLKLSHQWGHWDILLSMFSSQWRFFSSISGSSQPSETAQCIINTVIQNQPNIYGYMLHLDAEKLSTIGLYVSSGYASLQTGKLTEACVTTVKANNS